MTSWTPKVGACEVPSGSVHEARRLAVVQVERQLDREARRGAATGVEHLRRGVRVALDHAPRSAGGEE
ncbi:MAG TPA: hypothetical protein VHS27_08995, partial [Gaiellales bacterium]|nr:hypothetical protein [Gaiellales bacterium]